MGRIKEISRRPAHKRKRNPVVYLICEGTETEIRYFKRFRSRGCHIDIIPIPFQYKAADQLVRKARATMGMHPYYPDEGDVIWCVFDRDENTDAALRGAKHMADREGTDWPIRIHPLNCGFCCTLQTRGQKLRTVRQ